MSWASPLQWRYPCLLHQLRPCPDGELQRRQRLLLPQRGLPGLGEIISFYTHPDHRGKGYGGLLFDEAVRRLKEDGFPSAFVFVLRENGGGRRFYESHGFRWDGTHADIPFPPDAICVDLRYTKTL